MKGRPYITVLSIGLLILVAFPSQTPADVAPGDVLDQSNYEKAEGLLPDALDRRAAGTGARIALLNRGSRAEIERRARQIEKVETAVDAGFQQPFHEHGLLGQLGAALRVGDQDLEAPAGHLEEEITRIRKAMDESVIAYFGEKPDDLETYVLATQICQGEAYKLWTEHCRQRKEDWQCGGILLWNVADCWPQFSDAVIERLAELTTASGR